VPINRAAVESAVWPFAKLRTLFFCGEIVAVGLAEQFEFLELAMDFPHFEPFLGTLLSRICDVFFAFSLVFQYV